MKLLTRPCLCPTLSPLEVRWQKHASLSSHGTEMEEECRITLHKKITEMLRSEEGLEQGTEKEEIKESLQTV